MNMNDTPNSQELLLRWMWEVSWTTRDTQVTKAFDAYKASLLKEEPICAFSPDTILERKAREWWIEIRLNETCVVFHGSQAMAGKYKTNEMVHVREVLPSKNEQSK